MTTTEMAEKLGEKPKAILDALRLGTLKGEKIPDNGPRGYHWKITTSLEEAKEAMANRVRHASPKQPRRSTVKMPVTLPTSKDLFRPGEAAKAAGIGLSVVYKFLKEHNVTTLKNGRISYIPRTAIEQMRETFHKPEPQTIEPPRVQATKPDPRIDRLEKEVAAVFGFLTRFAKSCGYEE